MPTPHPTAPEWNTEICSAENIAFLMLSEVLRARSQDILDNLKQESIDVNRLRRLALHLRLSADDLIRGSGLVKNDSTQKTTIPNENEREPASVQAVVDLCLIAARHRLSEMNLLLESSNAPADLFVAGNPWELSYALFLALIHAGHAACQRPQLPWMSASSNERQIHLRIHPAEGFVDLIIPTHQPLDPDSSEEIESESQAAPSGRMKRKEWFCFRRLLETNNTQVQIQRESSQSEPRYLTVLRLPTFQPGHEDPLQFIKVSSPDEILSQES
ncbi:MAG: hypothetical protein RIR26_1969 [Pseudomonadota bacterium]|jgi:hypothetical protein